MKFDTKRPDTEDPILVLSGDGIIIQGHYYFSEHDYYTHDGELIEDAQGWAEIPDIEIV